MYSSLGPRKYGKKETSGKRALLLLSRTRYMASQERGLKKLEGMHNSILAQGCKILSLIEDCSKTYRTTYDEIFAIDLLG